jgi:hypothetical protein
MSELRSLQRSIARSILGHKETATLAVIAADGLAPSARLQVYRHHYEISLTETLKAIYPVICRLVDSRFFAFAARIYIKAAPPRRACLHEYGADFPDFLEGFPPVQHLAYLPDVARLEQAINQSLHSPVAVALKDRDFQQVLIADYPRLIFRLLPSLRYLETPWPVDRIWLANQEDANPAIDLLAGGTQLEIRQRGEEVVFCRLDAGEFELRRALLAGRTLEAAADLSFARDPQFDLTMALRRLFAEALIVKFDVLPAECVSAPGALT